MEIRKMQKEIYECAIRHGWWDIPIYPGESLQEAIYAQIPEKIALCHSELSEALECYRNGSIRGVSFVNETVHGKPEGFAIELADAIIRILDLSEAVGLDIQSAMEIKMKYNETRTYRHGGK